MQKNQTPPDQKEMNDYAEEIIKKLQTYKKNKKFHMVFLRNLNDLLASTLDVKDLQLLEKDLSDQYNKVLSQNHKQVKAKGENVVKKLNMRDYQDEEVYDSEEEDYGDDYKGFKKK
jgi:hypothetical protein